jgi:hypothetical protein
MLEPTPGDPHSLAAKSTGGGGHGSISFEDFADATLAAVTKALAANPRLFPHPEITVGIVIRRNYNVDVPDLDASTGQKL